jgi:hypothetical protein
MLFGGNPRPLCPESVRPHRCASSVSTLPLRVRSRGRASARPMGFPPPLSPTHKLRTATPRCPPSVGLGSLPERFMGKQIVVCHLPVPLLGARPQSPPFSSCPKARKMLHRASVPCPGGTLTVSHAHRSPEGDPHVIRSCTISKSSPNRSSTSGSCLLP